MASSLRSALLQSISSLPPRVFGVASFKVRSLRKLGVGEGNVNYFFSIWRQQFICRVNIDKGVPTKARDEYSSLRAIRGLKIAPQPYYLCPAGTNDKFPFGYLIIEYFVGTPLRKKQRLYSREQIISIARLLARLHTRSPRGWKRTEYSYTSYLEKSQEYVRAIAVRSPCLQKKFLELLKMVAHSLPSPEQHQFSLIHGDVCPQNIIATGSDLKLIDWESLRCSDPARDIANILIDLELKGDDLALFLKTYQRLRADATLLERARVYALLLRCTYCLWEIERSFEIMNGELPKEYLSMTTAERHINEAKHQYRKLRELIDAPDLPIDRLFSTSVH